MMSDDLNKDYGESFFYKVLLIVFVIRFTLSAWIPILGDEAYFVIWGNNLDYGYYDHPPLVGWLLSFLLLFSDATWWLRLPAVLLPIILSFLIFKLLKPKHPNVAVLVALVYLVAPVNIINFLITTDTPLVFFSFISVIYFYQAVYETNSNKDYLLAGLYLGLAFFSKYFAAILGITYGLYILLYHRDKKSLIGLFLVTLMVIPFIMVNLLWNYNNCGNNFLFNLVNRTAGDTASLSNIGKYAGILLYLFTPAFAYFLIKERHKIKSQLQNTFSKFYIWLSVIPLILFLILAIKKPVGLHWLFSFYPFVFIAFAGVLSVKRWRILFHIMWIFSLLHVILLSSIMILPTDMFSKGKESVQNIVYGKYPHEVLAHLKPYEKDYHFATISYGISSTASYYSKKHFLVFNKASLHAREDDKLTNYKKVDGENVVIFKRTASNLDKLGRYFKSSERKTFEVRGATFELLIGDEFNYALYREEILKKVNKEFYKTPSWLPVGQCEFKNKYGFD